MNEPRHNYEQLLAYAVGELSAGERPAVEILLDTDEQARAVVARYRRIARTVAEDDSQAPSPAQIDRVKAIFDRHPAPERPVWLERLQDALATLIFDSRLERAGVRVADTGNQIQLTYEHQGVEVDMLGRRDEETGQWRLRGQVSDTTGAPMSMAIIRANDQSMYSIGQTDVGARFDIMIPQGQFDLCIGLPERALRIPLVELQ